MYTYIGNGSLELQLRVKSAASCERLVSVEKEKLAPTLFHFYSSFSSLYFPRQT